jgi:hypothetical protein
LILKVILMAFEKRKCFDHLHSIALSIFVCVLVSGMHILTFVKL